MRRLTLDVATRVTQMGRAEHNLGIVALVGHWTTV
jgi:hypothetical protein